MPTPVSPLRQKVIDSLTSLFEREGVKVVEVLPLRSSLSVDCSSEQDARKVEKLLREAGSPFIAVTPDPDSDLWFVMGDYPARA